jgi:hypothetical protein
MNMLPNDPGDRAGTHKAHDHDFLPFHDWEGERCTAPWLTRTS